MTMQYVRDTKTAWTYTYHVYIPSGAGYPTIHLGLVYRDSDGKWHAISANGAREGQWPRRKDAAYYLKQVAP